MCPKTFDLEDDYGRARAIRQGAMLSLVSRGKDKNDDHIACMAATSFVPPHRSRAWRQSASGVSCYRRQRRRTGMISGIPSHLCWACGPTVCFCACASATSALRHIEMQAWTLMRSWRLPCRAALWTASTVRPALNRSLRSRLISPCMRYLSAVLAS